MRTHDITFAAEAKQFWFHCIEIPSRRNIFFKNGIQRSAQTLARRNSIRRRVLVAVGNPDIGHARCPESASESGANLTTTPPMLDPKLADGFVAVGQGESVRGLGMRKKSWIEIETEPVLFGPGHPVPKMFGTHFIPIHFGAAQFAVDGMQIDAVPSGNQRQRL